MAKKTKKTEDDGLDFIGKSIVKQYGHIIESGEKVLSDLNEYKVISLSPALDLALGGGIREGSCAVMTGDPKTGKAQNLSSIVYTTSGPKKMGDIKIGDNVCTPDGGSGRVVGIFPQGVRDVYRITFNDGAYADCDIEHLWKVKRNNSRTTDHYDWKILSLKDILSEGLRYSDRPKWRIPLTSPVSFKDQDQLIPAYTLGCLIGDGGIKSGSPVITSIDGEIVSHFMIYAHSLSLECKPTEEGGINYRISHPENKVGDNKLINYLKALKLWGCGSHNKFIPDQYKYGSIEQRLELIKGLMDTDGYNDRGKNAEYATVSEQLALDVREVLQSLGYTAKIKERVTKCDGREFPSYRLHISGHCVSDLFSLKRKIVDRHRVRCNLTRTIVKVEKIGREECQCIKIDHTDHLYLTDNFVVTHNTTTALYFASKCQALNKSVYYLNTEGRITKENFTGIKGLDPSKIKIIQSTDKQPLVSAESYLNALEILIKNTEGFVGIVDSVSNMVPKDELEGEIRTGVRNALPRLLSMFLKRISGDVARNKAIVIFITHNIANTSGARYAPLKMADCGNMLQYQAGTNMIIQSRGKWESEDGSSDIGQVANWIIKTSASGGIPNSKAESWIRYGVGIDEAREICELGVQFSIIHKNGSWFKILPAISHPEAPVVRQIVTDFGKNPDSMEDIESVFKMQGMASVYNMMNQYPDLVSLVFKEMKDIF